MNDSDKRRELVVLALNALVRDLLAVMWDTTDTRSAQYLLLNSELTLAVTLREQLTHNNEAVTL